MMLSTLKKIAKENSFLQSKDQFAGVYNGYFYCLGKGKNSKYITLEFLTLTKNQIDDLTAELTKNKKVIRFNRFSVAEGNIGFEFDEIFLPTSKKRLIECMNFLSKLLRHKRVETNHHFCNKCKSNLNLTYYDLQIEDKAWITVLCDNCSAQMEKDFKKDEKKAIELSNSYFMGFLGALLFSITFTLGWVFLNALLPIWGIFTTVFFPIMPWLGYIQLKGKPGPYMSWIILAVLMFNLVSANGTFYLLSLWVYSNPDFEFASMFIQEKNFTPVMLINIGISAFLFIIVLKYLPKKANSLVGLPAAIPFKPFKNQVLSTFQ